MRKALFILGELDDRDVIFLSREGILRQMAAGDTLIEAGSIVDQLYFIMGGDFEVQSRSGRDLARLQLGDVVGEMSFIERRPPDAHVIAVTGARVLAVSQEALLAQFDRDPAMAARFYRALAKFLSDRLRTMSMDGPQELDEMVLDTVQQAGERFSRLVAMVEGR
jgi:CRP-like cAMP-binding protein